MTPLELIEKISCAGVVGAGGAGFPSDVKFKGNGIDHYLINCAECEPLLENNMALISQEAQYLAETAKQVENIMGVVAVFCIKAKHVDEIKLLRKEGAHVFEMGDYYPAGDEIILIHEATGRTVPEGKLPFSVGVIVNNVETLYNIGKAMEDIPVTHKWVTVGGAVKVPAVWRVPIGTSSKDLLDLAGGSTIDDPVFIDGGPMTGSYREKTDFYVTKKSNGFLVVPASSCLYRYERMSVESILKQAKTACCQCTQCSLVCSRNLIGYRIEPHRIMRALAYPSQITPDVLKMALLCSDCNLCSGLHACPMQLSPRRVNQELKKSLRSEGITLGDLGPVRGSDPARSGRLLPTHRLIRRIGLSRWNVVTPYRGNFSPSHLRISLSQHIGAPSVPVVSVGETVVEGQVIGKIPEGTLGAALHSPVTGKVISLDGRWLELETEGGA